MINSYHFEELYDLYYTGLCAYALRFVDCRQQAEDIVHDVFCQLWSNRNKISINQSKKAYLFLSIKNRCLDYIRHNNVHSRYEEIMKNDGEVSVNFTWEHFVEKEIEVFVNNAIDNLPNELKEIFIINKIEGKTAKEIAEVTGVSVRTIEGKIARSLKILKENFTKLNYLLLMIWVVLMVFVLK